MPFVLKPGEAHVGIWPFLQRTLWKAPPEDNFLEYPCNSHALAPTGTCSPELGVRVLCR